MIGEKKKLQMSKPSDEPTSMNAAAAVYLQIRSSRMGII